MYVNVKTIPDETIPGMKGEEIKGKHWRGLIQVGYI
jgi:hypothetical protein